MKNKQASPTHRVNRPFLRKKESGSKGHKAEFKVSSKARLDGGPAAGVPAQGRAERDAL